MNKKILLLLLSMWGFFPTLMFAQSDNLKIPYCGRFISEDASTGRLVLDVTPEKATLQIEDKSFDCSIYWDHAGDGAVEIEFPMEEFPYIRVRISKGASEAVPFDVKGNFEGMPMAIFHKTQEYVPGLKQKSFKNEGCWVTYNYIVDDLGYFAKFHGMQQSSRSVDHGRGLISDRILKIEYNQGAPISFFFKGDVGYAYKECEVESRGGYNDRGICSMVSKSEGSRDRVMFALEDGDKWIFGGTVDINSNNIHSSTFGWINGNRHFIVSSFEKRGKPELYPPKRYAGNSILIDGDLYYFDNENLLSTFLQSASSYETAEDLINDGFYWNEGVYPTYTEDYLKLKEKGKDESYLLAVALRTPTPTTLGTYRPNDGFTTEKDGLIIPKEYFSSKIGPGYSRLHCEGLDIDSGIIKNVYKVSQYVYHREKALQSIVFLTEEQYEKYKSQLEYDGKTQRHGVKKADGTYLYVPDKYEKLIVKSDEELRIDEKEVAYAEKKLKDAEALYNAAVAVAEFQQQNGDLMDALKSWNLDTIDAAVSEHRREIAERRKKEAERVKKMRSEIDRALSSNDFETFEHLCQQMDDSDLKAEFKNALFKEDYSTAHRYAGFLKKRGLGNDWFLSLIDNGRNINSVVYNINYSNDESLISGTKQKVVSGIDSKGLYDGDYSYFLKLADIFPSINDFNVLALFLSMKGMDDTAVLKYSEKVSNLDSLKLEGDKNPALKWNNSVIFYLTPEKNTVITNKKVLQLCAFLDSKGKISESYMLSSLLLGNSLEYLQDYKSYPGIVINAIMKADLNSQAFNQSFVLSFIGLMDATYADNYQAFLDTLLKDIQKTILFKNSQLEKIFYYAKAHLYFNTGQYERASEYFKLSEYADYKDRRKQCKSRKK